MDNLENKEILADFTRKEEKSAVDTLASVIKSACQRIVAQAGFDRTVAGVIVGNAADIMHMVQMEGSEYSVMNGLGSILPIGTPVWVTIPCNKRSNAYISGVRGKNIVTHGVAAWCSASFSTTTVTMQKSYNIKSIVASTTATGVYTVTFLHPMPDASYAVCVGAEASGRGTEIIGVYGKSKTGFTIDVTNYSGEAVYVSVMSIAVIR